MLIINLNFQGIAIMWNKISLYIEKIFEKANILKQIKEAIKKFRS